MRESERKDKRNEGGISVEKRTGFTDDKRGKRACGRVRSRRAECVCEGFQSKCWAAGEGGRRWGGSFVHREQREEGEVRVGE